MKTILAITPAALLIASTLFGQSEKEKLANLLRSLETTASAYRELSRASRLNCLLGPGHATSWESGRPSSTRGRFTKESDPTIFYNINRESKIATMMGNLGSSEVAVIEAGGGLTFLEVTKGGINVTTVFSSYMRGTKRFPCVHSRHLLVAFINPMPSQYHGTCEAQADP